MASLMRVYRWSESWFLWVVVTAVSWAIALVLMGVFAAGLEPFFHPTIGLLLGSTPGGLLIGVMQWTFLRPAGRDLGTWLAVTAVGFAAGLLLGALAVMFTGSRLGLLLGGTLGGLLMTLLQLAAFHPGARRQREWLIHSAAGWITAAALGAYTSQPEQDTLATALADTAVALVAGLSIMCTLALTALVVAFPEIDYSRVRSGRWM